MKKFKFKEKLDGERIYLKKHDVTLAQTMFDYVDKDRERLSRFLAWVDFTKTVQDEINYIKHTHECWDNGNLFDYGIYRKDDDEYLGNCGVHTIRWDHDCCELGYWILGDFEGQGFMSESVRILERYLFSEGFNRVQIRCSDLNGRSENVPANKRFYSFLFAKRKTRKNYRTLATCAVGPSLYYSLYSDVLISSLWRSA